MPQVIWTQPATINLQEIYSYLQFHNPDAASRALLTIKSSVNILLNHPRAGRLTSTPQVDQRELIIPFGSSGYILLYSIHDDDILIHALRHQKQVGFT